MNKEIVTKGSGADDPGGLHGQNSGILYGIGVGPGNPKLMTLEAIETIRSACSVEGRVLCLPHCPADMSGN